MKIHLSILLLAVLITLCGVTSIAQEDRPAHFGLVYPSSTNGVDAATIRNNFSVQAIYGLSTGESGLGLYGVGGITKGDAKGLMVSGVWTDIQGTLQGVQMSAFSIGQVMPPHK